MTIGLVDLQRQREAIGDDIETAVGRVLAHGRFINGPEVAELETRLARRLGIGHAVGCASGTAALELLLRADRIGAGDAVIVPSLTFVGTAEAVALTGATPVFADVRARDATLCPDSVRAAAAMVSETDGLRLRAVMAVDLFSLPADHRALSAICAELGIRLFYDAAHSIGTETPDGACGSYGDGAGTSFYPSKALGGYGDGGAVFARDDDFAGRVRSLVNHGARGEQGHVAVGSTARLDTLQAAILLAKLDQFDSETVRRREIAAAYRAALSPVCAVPPVADGVRPVWSYFAIAHPERDALKAHLAQNDIGSVDYYSVPTHLHPAYRGFPVSPGGLARTESFSQTILCLPMHPYLRDDEVGRVIDGVLSFGGTAAASPFGGYADVA